MTVHNLQTHSCCHRGDVFYCFYVTRSAARGTWRGGALSDVSQPTDALLLVRVEHFLLHQWNEVSGSTVPQIPRPTSLSLNGTRQAVARIPLRSLNNSPVMTTGDGARVNGEGEGVIGETRAVSDAPQQENKYKTALTFFDDLYQFLTKRVGPQRSYCSTCPVLVT